MMRGMYRRKLKDFAELQKEQQSSLLERLKDLSSINTGSEKHGHGRRVDLRI